MDSPDMVRHFDARRQYNEPGLKDAVNQAIARVIDSGQFIGGHEVAEFEKRVARYLHVRHAVGVSSGSDALLVSLMALGIGPGDEVITTPFTFFATVGAIMRVGAVPVFADIGGHTGSERENGFNIDPDCVAKMVTSKTKAIIPVHLFGEAADMDSIMEIAGGQSRAVFVIEDAAQALGARCLSYASVGRDSGRLPGWRFVGGLGDLGCFSFFPTKNLGCMGDGGLVVTEDDDVAETVRAIRNHGVIREKYFHELPGGNFRLDAIQAAVLNVKLSQLPWWLDQRASIAKRYAEGFSGVDDITLPCPVHRAIRLCYSWNQFTLRVTGGPAQRDALRRHLADHGIESQVYYPIPMHQQPVVREYYRRMDIDSATVGAADGDCPNAERVSGEVLSLPMFPELTSEEQDRVVCSVREFFNKNV